MLSGLMRGPRRKNLAMPAPSATTPSAMGFHSAATPTSRYLEEPGLQQHAAGDQPGDTVLSEVVGAGIEFAIGLARFERRHGEQGGRQLADALEMVDRIDHVQLQHAFAAQDADLVVEGVSLAVAEL